MYAIFTEQPSEEDLEHFGVKGMKWGVRKAVETSGLSRHKQGKEYKYAKKASSFGMKVALYNTACDKINDGLDGLNEKYKDKKISVGKDKDSWDDDTKSYMKDYEDLFRSSMDESAAEYGASKYGTLRVAYTGKGSTDPFGFEVVPNDEVKHADDIADEDATVKPMFFEFVIRNGKILRTKAPVVSPDTLMHSDDYIEHFGVKGMKWGVRRSEKHAAQKQAERDDWESMKKSRSDARARRSDARAQKSAQRSAKKTSKINAYKSKMSGKVYDDGLSIEDRKRARDDFRNEASNELSKANRSYLSLDRQDHMDSARYLQAQSDGKQYMLDHTPESVKAKINDISSSTSVHKAKKQIRRILNEYDYNTYGRSDDREINLQSYKEVREDY